LMPLLRVKISGAAKALGRSPERRNEDPAPAATKAAPFVTKARRVSEEEDDEDDSENAGTPLSSSSRATVRQAGRIESIFGVQ